MKKSSSTQVSVADHVANTTFEVKKSAKTGAAAPRKAGATMGGGAYYPPVVKHLQAQKPVQG